MTKEQLLAKLKAAWAQEVLVGMAEEVYPEMAPEDRSEIIVHTEQWLLRINAHTSIATLIGDYTDPASGYGASDTDGVEDLLVAALCR